MTEANRARLIGRLKKELQSQEGAQLANMQRDALRDLINRKLQETIENARTENPMDFQVLAAMNFRERRGILDAVYEAINGYGILGEIIADDNITEVMINGYKDIFVERKGNSKLQRLNARFEDVTELTTIIQRFVNETGRTQVSEGHPIVDTRLKKDGSRVNVVMPPIALDGPVVTIRRFPEPVTIEKLIAWGSITPEVAEILELLVQARYNIFVSGGTGSGKTTFLNALSDFIPRDERIITIEDSAELQIRNVDNLVRLETRDAGPDGSAAITITDLIRSALRMRPDRIVVGEVRGKEALDMLQAMNTGHDGSLSTGHANSTRDMLSRLETMVLMGASGLPSTAICQQIASSIDIIIHLSRLRDKSRRTMAISEILSYDPNLKEYQINPLYEFREDMQKSSRKEVVGSLIRTENKMVQTDKLLNAGIYREI